MPANGFDLLLISARPQFPPGTFALIDWENGRMEFSVGTVGTIAAEMPAYRRYVRSEPDVCVPAADDARSCRGQGSIPTLTGTLKKKTGRSEERRVGKECRMWRRVV